MDGFGFDADDADDLAVFGFRLTAAGEADGDAVTAGKVNIGVDSRARAPVSLKDEESEEENWAGRDNTEGKPRSGERRLRS